MPRETRVTSTLRWADGVPATHDKIWPRDKHRLKVRFLNGSSGEKQLVKNLIVEHYHVIPMHIRFKFLRSSDTSSSDIRITFTRSGCSSSRIGRYSENVAADEATMKLNMNQESRRKIQADVLHEFGHALGLEHEQKHPDCALNFNRSELKRRHGYDDAFIDRNYGKGTVIGARTTPYNTKSIMHYPVELGETMSWNTYIPLNTVLSKDDKQLLMNLYPADPERKPKSKLSERVLITKPTTTTIVKKPRHRTKKQTLAVPTQPIYVSGSGNNVVQGGYVVIRGSGNTVINGDSEVEISGSGSVTLNGNGTVRKSGSGTLVVNGNCVLETRGSGTVNVRGSGMAKVFGSGSVNFSGMGSGTVHGSGSIRQYCSI